MYELSMPIERSQWAVIGAAVSVCHASLSMSRTNESCKHDIYTSHASIMYAKCTITNAMSHRINEGIYKWVDVTSRTQKTRISYKWCQITNWMSQYHIHMRYVYMYINLYTYIQTCTSTYVSSRSVQNITSQTLMSIYIYIYICLYMQIYIYICIHIHVNVYICIYIYINVYIYICIES